MVLLLCDQRLLLVMLMQLLLQFLGGCCRRLCLRRGADRLRHECACRSLAAAVVVVVVLGTVTAALAAALCVSLMALASLLRARLVDACYGVGKTGFRGGKVTLRPELAAVERGGGGGY